MNNWKKYSIVFVIFFVLQALMFTIFINNKNSEIQKRIDEQQKNFVSTYNTIFTTYSALPKVVFYSSINTKDISSIIFKANNTKDKAYKSLLRKKIHEELIDAYKSTLASSGFKELQFYLKNGENFLRFSQPTIYGDNLSKTRNSIQAIERLKRPIEGFESGKFFNGYRYVYPLFYNAKFVGSVGITLDIDTYLKIAQEALNGEQRFIIKYENIIKSSLKTRKQKFIRSPLEPSFIYQERNNTTMFHLLHTISKENKEKIIQRLNGNQTFSVPIKIKDKNHLTTFLPIKNMEKNVVGFIIGITQADFIDTLHENFIKNVTLTLVSSFLVVILLFGYFKEKEFLKKLVEYKNKLEEKVEIKTQELTQNTQLLQTIIETIPTPIFYKNLEGKYKACNKSFAKFAKLEPHDIIGKETKEIFPKHITTKFMNSDKKVLQKRKTLSIETIMRVDEKDHNIVIYKNLLQKDDKPIGIIGVMHDVTRQIRSQEKLKKAFFEIERQQEALKKDYEIIQKYTLYTKMNTEFQILEISDGLCHILGCDKDHVIGMKISDIQKNDVDELKRENIKEALLKEHIWQGEFSLLMENNKRITLRSEISAEYDENNQITGFISFSQDISKEKIIQELSYKDELTQIYNRKKFNEELESLLNMFKRYKDKTSLILFDIDKFKEINDTYGHLIGDKILVELASIISSNIRDCDVFARWGGEEFVLILPKTDKENTIKTAQKLRQKIISHDFDIGNSVTCSFGLTQFLEDDTVDSIITRVDNMLYEAKNKGRDKIIYD